MAEKKEQAKLQDAVAAKYRCDAPAGNIYKLDGKNLKLCDLSLAEVEKYIGNGQLAGVFVEKDATAVVTEPAKAEAKKETPKSN